MKARFVASLLLGVSLCALQAAARADQAPAEKKAEGLDLDTIVVTASSGNGSKMQSSISVSSLDPDQIEQAAPSSVADILRNIPGIRSEASGGEGNANALTHAALDPVSRIPEFKVCAARIAKASADLPRHEEEND